MPKSRKLAQIAGKIRFSVRHSPNSLANSTHG